MASANPSIIVVVWSARLGLTSFRVYWSMPSFCKYRGFWPVLTILLMLSFMSFKGLGQKILHQFDSWSSHRGYVQLLPRPECCLRIRPSFHRFNIPTKVCHFDTLQRFLHLWVLRWASGTSAQFAFWWKFFVLGVRQSAQRGWYRRTLESCSCRRPSAWSIGFGASYY